MTDFVIEVDPAVLVQWNDELKFLMSAAKEGAQLDEAIKSRYGKFHLLTMEFCMYCRSLHIEGSFVLTRMEQQLFRLFEPNAKEKRNLWQKFETLREDGEAVWDALRAVFVREPWKVMKDCPKTYKGSVLRILDGSAEA